MKTLHHILRTAVLACVPFVAAAQVPLKIITSDQPGGGMDVLIRPMAEKLSTALGRPVLVDNKPGAQGRLAGQAVVSAPPDGNTLLITVQAGIVINPHAYTWPYKTQTDLIPVTDLGNGSLLLLAPASTPAANFGELANWMKAQPKGSVNYGTYSPGTISHFGGVLLGQALGVELQPVHYKASADQVKDLVGAQVQLGWGPAAGAVGQLVKAGRLKALAYGGPKRAPAFPDVPTMRELGYPAVEQDGWIGIFAPAGTPADTVGKLQQAIAKVLATPEIRTSYVAVGFEPGGSSPADFTKVVRTDWQRYAEIIQKIGYKAE